MPILFSRQAKKGGGKKLSLLAVRCRVGVTTATIFRPPINPCDSLQGAAKERQQRQQAAGLVHNAGVGARDAKDLAAIAAEAHTTANITRALEAKAARYAELRRTGGAGVAGDDNILVDFEAKRLDDLEAAARAPRPAMTASAAVPPRPGWPAGTGAPGPAEPMGASAAELVTCVGGAGIGLLRPGSPMPA